MVTRKYAASLLGCFAESIPPLEAMRAIRSPGFATVRFAVDMVWQRLQRRDRWFVGTPSFGRQRPSFSDIEQRDVNYDGQTYGLAATAP